MTVETSQSACRVLVSDPVSERGIELLRSTEGFEVTVKTGMPPDELAAALAEHDALIVRSATKVTAEVLGKGAGRLRVIGRAGTGVDNIDLDAATRAGVVVVNTPGGNSVAAAELAFSLLLALARNVPQANAELRQGRWERKKYMGVEVQGKTLGVVGLGRIGREVARRAKGFRMEVLGYDPFVSNKVAEDIGVGAASLEELVEASDFISLHLPVSNDTRHLFDGEMLGRMKPDARLINAARGGLVDETALFEALEAGRLAGAALDVFENEPPSGNPLVAHPRVVSTPHLGASTREAQERVGTEIAVKIRDFLQSGVILDAVNFPSIGREEYAVLGPVMDLAERLGSFLGQLADGGLTTLEVRTHGSFCDHSLRPVAMAATRGVLSPAMHGAVSYVNALSIAADRGVTVEESRSNESTPFTGLLRLTVKTDSEEATVAGTLYGAERPRLVEVNGVSVESYPEGHLLFVRNRDVPGVVGRIGNILGGAGVNIAGIQLGRANGGQNAVSIINVDTHVPDDVLEQIRRIGEIVMVRAIDV